jgi:hypothetical protein
LHETASSYRKSLWSQAAVRVEVWLENDALAGVVVDVTDENDVPLKVEIPKRTIGAHKGVPIVVAPANELLAVSIHEGVEDALSEHQATGLGSWAAGGASFMRFRATSRLSRSSPIRTKQGGSALGIKVLLHGGT